jgi:hypothetical protein
VDCKERDLVAEHGKRTIQPNGTAHLKSHCPVGSLTKNRRSRRLLQRKLLSRPIPRPSLGPPVSLAFC